GRGHAPAKVAETTVHARNAEAQGEKRQRQTEAVQNHEQDALALGARGCREGEDPGKHRADAGRPGDREGGTERGRRPQLTATETMAPAPAAHEGRQTI